MRLKIIGYIGIFISFLLFYNSPIGMEAPPLLLKMNIDKLVEIENQSSKGKNVDTVEVPAEKIRSLKKYNDMCSHIIFHRNKFIFYCIGTFLLFSICCVIFGINKKDYESLKLKKAQHPIIAVIAIAISILGLFFICWGGKYGHSTGLWLGYISLAIGFVIGYFATSYQWKKKL